MITPHDFGSNVVHISVRKNPQKQRKPNADPHKRAQTYWDGQSRRHQREYDARLDGLPDFGVADTVSESHSAPMHCGWVTHVVRIGKMKALFNLPRRHCDDGRIADPSTINYYYLARPSTFDVQRRTRMLTCYNS